MIREKRGLSLIVLVGLWLAAVYLVGLPLIGPRGPFLWGHYRFIDIYVGVPLLLIAVCASLLVFAAGKSRRGAALKLSTLVLSVLFTLIVADVGYAFILRGAWKSSPNDVWFDGTSVTGKDNLPDDELGFVRKAGLTWEGRLTPESRYVTYRTDEHGFRNANGVTKADVVFIGDSFTEGASVPEEDTFVQQFSRGAQMSVVNLGRGYYGPQQEAIILKRYGLNYHPSLVVWQIFEGNDLRDASHFAAWRTNPPRESIMLRYTKKSLIAQLLTKTIPKEQAGARAFDEGPGQRGQLFLDYQYQPDEPARDPLGMSETRKAIEEGFRLCRAAGIDLVIVFIPIKVRVLAPYVHFLNDADREHYLPGGKLDSDGDFSNELARFCQQLGCPFLDVTTALRKRAADDNRLVYSVHQDSHLDIDGHKVVAGVLEEWRKTSLISKPVIQAK